MSVSIDEQDWLKHFLDFVIQNYNPDIAEHHSSQSPENQKGISAINASLQRRGASFGLPTLDPLLSASQEFPPTKFLSILKHQVEIIFDVAVALQRPFEGYYGRLSALLILSANLQAMDHIAPLAEAWRQVTSHERDINEFTELLEEQYIPIGAALKDRAILKSDPLLALPINQGMSYFNIRFSGLLAEALHDDTFLKEHELESLLQKTQHDKMLCIEATISLAWSNGLIEPEERNLIKKQIEAMQLGKKERRKLLNLMITPSTPSEFARAFTNLDTSLFVLRQLVLTSFIDGQQDTRERKFLYQTSKAFGIEEEQFQEIQQEMKAFIENNRENVMQMKKNRRFRPSMI